MRSTLYITKPGAFVHRTGARLRVMRGSTLIQELRIEDLERVVILSGSAGLTASAATALMEAGVETAFVSSTGGFRGWLSPAAGRGVLLRLSQYRFHHHATARLGFARAVVARKIANGMALLRRFARNHTEFSPNAELARMERAEQSARAAASVESLLGHEGDAAAAYFQAFGRMLRNGFLFTVRSRRPPADPANALLSFGYTLLTTEATVAVAGAGLEPALGMLHTPEDGRPSLALDLTEEFRQPMVDRLVLALINNRVISTADFDHPGADGVRMNTEARRRFLQAYEDRMNEPFVQRLGTPPTTLRTELRDQARRMARAIAEQTDYHPFSFRG